MAAEFVTRDGTQLSGFSGWVSFDAVTYDVVCPGEGTRRDDGSAIFYCDASGFSHVPLGRIPPRDYAALLAFEITENGSAASYSGSTTVVFDDAFEMCGHTCPTADDVTITVD